MILNLYTILMIFIAAVAIGLGLFLGVYAFMLYKRSRAQISSDAQSLFEARTYLVLLMAVVLLVVRLLSWPLFYATLLSFVPDIEGAMCIYGVTQVLPQLSTFLQMVKPIVFFLIGAWLLLHGLDRKTKTYALMSRKFLFLLVVTLFILADSLGDLVYMFKMNPTTTVYCCTTVFDIGSRPSSLISQSLLGQAYRTFMIPLYYVSNLVLMGSVGLVLSRGGLKNPARRRRFTLIALVALALLNVAAVALALIEDLGPKLMNLPYHHDPYDLVQKVPDSPIFVALFILGTFAIGWALVVDVIGTKEETREIIPKYLRNLLKFSLLCLLLSLVMVSLHLLLG